MSDHASVTGALGYHLSLEGVFGHRDDFVRVGVLVSNIPLPSHVFSTTPVVGEEQYQCVVQFPGFFQRLHDVADPLVHAVDHGRVDFHEGDLPFLVFRVFPGGSLSVSR